MALSQLDLDRLDAAIASQTLSVEFQGRRVTYRSMEELLTARQHVASQIAAAADGANRRTTRRYTFQTMRGD